MKDDPFLGSLGIRQAEVLGEAAENMEACIGNLGGDVACPSIQSLLEAALALRGPDEMFPAGEFEIPRQKEAGDPVWNDVSRPEGIKRRHIFFGERSDEHCFGAMPDESRQLVFADGFL